MGKNLKGKEIGKGISQRKDGYYVARYVNEDGERIQRLFKTLADAKNWITDEKALSKLLSKDNFTLNEWYAIWLDTYKKDICADNTVKNYQNRYEQNIKPYLGKKDIKKITHFDCQRILNKMALEYSSGTIELTQITMHAIFKGAVINKLLAENPASNLVFKKEEKAEKRVLTKKEQKLFSEYALNSMYKNAYLLVLETGLRCGELGALKWENINFDERYIKVTNTLLQNTEKGGFYLGTPKTSSSKRLIPLTDKAMRLLLQQKREQEKLKTRSKKWEEKWEGLVFTTVNGNPVGNSTFRKMLNYIIKNINTDAEILNIEQFPYITMHSLRHTFATRAIENGVNPKTLQKIMGHSNLTTTMDLYVHVTDEQLFEEIKKINA